MNGVALELEETLRRLDPPAAAALEQLVRGALVLATRPTSERGALLPAAAVDVNGWPVGYFERYAGSLADDDWEPPADPPPEPTPER